MVGVRREVRWKEGRPPSDEERRDAVEATAAAAALAVTAAAAATAAIAAVAACTAHGADCRVGASPADGGGAAPLRLVGRGVAGGRDPMAPRPGVQRDERARLLVVAAGGPAAAHVARQQREREGAGEVGEHERGAEAVHDHGQRGAALEAQLRRAAEQAERQQGRAVRGRREEREGGARGLRYIGLQPAGEEKSASAEQAIRLRYLTRSATRLRAQRGHHPIAEQRHAAPEQEEPHGERLRRRAARISPEGADAVCLAQQRGPPRAPPLQRAERRQEARHRHVQRQQVSRDRGQRQRASGMRGAHLGGGGRGGPGARAQHPRRERDGPEAYDAGEEGHGGVGRRVGRSVGRREEVEAIEAERKAEEQQEQQRQPIVPPEERGVVRERALVLQLLREGTAAQREAEQPPPRRAHRVHVLCGLAALQCRGSGLALVLVRLRLRLRLSVRPRPCLRVCLCRRRRRLRTPDALTHRRAHTSSGGVIGGLRGRCGEGLAHGRRHGAAERGHREVDPPQRAAVHNLHRADVLLEEGERLAKTARLIAETARFRLPHAVTVAITSAAAADPAVAAAAVDEGTPRVPSKPLGLSAEARVQPAAATEGRAWPGVLTKGEARRCELSRAAIGHEAVAARRGRGSERGQRPQEREDLAALMQEMDLPPRLAWLRPPPHARLQLALELRLAPRHLVLRRARLPLLLRARPSRAARTATGHRG
eukprot:scaffold14940_cov60-Phaeocystis_antarctica.AAC.1